MSLEEGYAIAMLVLQGIAVAAVCGSLAILTRSSWTSLRLRPHEPWLACLMIALSGMLARRMTATLLRTAENDWLETVDRYILPATISLFMAAGMVILYCRLRRTA